MLAPPLSTYHLPCMFALQDDTVGLWMSDGFKVRKTLGRPWEVTMAMISERQTFRSKTEPVIFDQTTFRFLMRSLTFLAG